MNNNTQYITAKTLVETLKGRIFSVDFITKSGAKRTLTGRTGVSKHVKGTGKPYGQEAANKYLKVFIMSGVPTSSADYRNVNINTIKSIRFNGGEFKFKQEEK